MSTEIDFEKYRKRGGYHWQAYFGSVTKIDSFLRARYDTVVHLLQKHVTNNSPKILEVGCGDGALSGLICKRINCTIYGIDPSQDGIEIAKAMFARQNLKGSFAISESYTFAFDEGYFDAVVLADVIEHVREPQTLLSEIFRVLKPGGLAIITTPVRTNEHPEDTMHVQEFFPEQLASICQSIFPKALEHRLTHPVVWYELYTFGKKWLRSLVRLYVRMTDKIVGSNVFLASSAGNSWKNFKQQALVVVK